MIVDHIWKLQCRNRIYTEYIEGPLIITFRELFVGTTKPLGTWRRILKLFAWLPMPSTSLSAMQRCLDLLQDCMTFCARGKSKIHTIHIHSHATCIHIHLTSIPSRATYTWTLSWSCSTCMSLVSRCWPGCFEKPVAAGCVVFRRNRAVLCRQSWQSNF